MPATLRSADIAVERWLEIAVRERHAAIWHEPVPEALRRLLQDDPET